MIGDEHGVRADSLAVDPDPRPDDPRGSREEPWGPGRSSEQQLGRYMDRRTQGEEPDQRDEPDDGAAGQPMLRAIIDRG
jgi:hypothetical protein